MEYKGYVGILEYPRKFNLRLSTELHKEVAVTAKKMKLSINSFVEKALRDEINSHKAL